ncbi:uncharacterized protein MONBRDRAFT_17838 [Monosiga brevicollis MX1]|uniref:Uncharacterized protein n=1 Tax=Monosiga brevicollis TaxID=81824 RepID=A9URM3_MONBE|nr:uncharacterized protein MONBRDRAFT_17838 [Monosiga brevicollis MX1]EDQ92268.1 predicted protein [Monosiga brevicollis MX1]|eukprot:XP_001743554.1 hypothetical protein [Monosiga brevicollis MX1]
MPLQESPYPIVDIGTNLLGVEQLQRARELNVQPLILTGTDLAGSRKRADLVRRHPGTLYSTAGIHPHQAKTFSPAVLEELRQLAQMPGVVAVGETGLDYNRNFSSPAQQRASFRAHVQLAAELDLPLFCHEREAHADFVAVLDEFPRLPPVIVHCFTGERPELHDYVQRGYYIGVTGYLGMQRRGAALREFLAAEVPLERLMIETDAPYMAPDAARPHIGRNNAPFTLPLVLDVVALLYGMDRADTARRLTQTTVEVFRLQAVHQS